MNKELTKATKIRLAIAFVVIFALLSGIFAFFEARMYYQRRENNLYLASNQARLIEGSLNTVMARVYTLSALVSTNHGDTAFFDESGKELYDETVEATGLYVKNFVLAPDGVVKYIYPMEGNENLVGLNYMDTSAQGNDAAVEAFEKGKLVLTDPFELKQGGTGIAGRLPVYINKDGQSEFWGMVAVTLDMEYLMKQFNLDYLTETGRDYCLWYQNGNGEKVIMAQSDGKMHSPIVYEINPSNLKWTLEIEPVHGWITPLELGAGMIGILVISLLILHVLETRARIKTINVALEEIAIKDNLTGCYSRHYVNVMLLEQGTKKWKDPNDQYSLALVDVDYFKKINDTYGHDVGDQALVAIANTLKQLCDELRGDCVIRYGGDEFVFLMNKAYRELFEERLDRIVKQVRELRIPEAPDMRLSVSVGGVWGDGTDNYYDLFSKADEQVYISKENGKDQYHVI